MHASDVKRELETLSDKKRANVSKSFFKTYEGGYGEWDKFLGLTVPVQRRVAKKYEKLPLEEVEKLLKSEIHEHRFVALEILVFQYESGGRVEKRKIVSFYLKNREWVNNWDLVDTSAPYILGDYLLDKQRNALYKLARSKSIWDRRIAIVSTSTFIKQGDFRDTLRLAEILLSDKHDLIHKAVGWMLREVGKRSEPALEGFLTIHHQRMPRTTLRYSLEKFSPKKRKKYMGR